MVDYWQRILPNQVFLRHLGAEVANLGAHVAMRQLEPSASEGIGKCIRVLVKAPRDGFVNRVEAQREVRCRHHRGMHLRGVMSIGNQVFRPDVFRDPLLGTSRAFG